MASGKSSAILLEEEVPPMVRKKSLPLQLLALLLSSHLFADTLTFQQGVAGYSGTTDTWLQGAVGNADHSSNSLLEWDGLDAGEQNFLLIRFDDLFGTLPGQIAATDIITSATLSFEVFNAGDQATISEVAIDWSPPFPTTFNNFGTSPGVQADDYGVSIGFAAGALGTQVLTVTSSIEAWAANPSLNLGWIIRPTGGTNGAEVRSSEANPTGVRPLLTVVVNEGAPTPASVIRGPYLQLLTSESIVLRWRTDNATTSAVRYGTSQGNLLDSISDPALTLDHEVLLEGLQPGTQYFYAVGTDSIDLAGDSLDHFFFTSPPAGSVDPFRVWVIGDCGTTDIEQFNVRDAYYGFTGSTHTDLWLMLGDNAYASGSDVQYQEAIFDIYQEMLIQTPFASTRGNHETDASVYYGLVSNPTTGQGGGLASGTEAYYSFDFANVHFICLDTEGSSLQPGSSMLSWLELDLASTAQEWIVTFFHHPPYTKGTHDSDDPTDSSGRMENVRENALPILEAGGVDLVLAGHSHVYERSYLIDGHYGTSATWNPATHLLDGGSGNPVADGPYQKTPLPNGGTVYVVMGSSGQSGTGTLDHPAMYTGQSIRGSLVLDFDNQNLQVTMVREDGSSEDVFVLSKEPFADCNGNLIPDSNDISTGSSSDCDFDGTPDECQIASGTQDDCNGNGNLDLCDVTTGNSPDSNSNGMPDECEGDLLIRGDSNSDGFFDISDPIFTIEYLFLNGAPTCMNALDSNDDEMVNIADVISSLGGIFGNGPLPPEPFPTCGLDPTPSALGCVTSQVCP